MNVLKKNGESVALYDIKQVYFIIEWKGKQDTKKNLEKVILTPNDK